MTPATLQAPGEEYPLDNTMGAMFIGVIVSAILYGISLIQTLYYYSHYRRDPLYMRAMVAVVVILDSVHLAFITHTLYYYLISKYYDHNALEFMVWTVLVESLPTGVTGALVQCFYAFRIWKLNNKSVLLAGIILVLVAANTACGTAWLIMSLLRKSYQELLGISALTMTINAISAATDVLIAASLCILLHRARTGFKSSDTMITRLTLFVVNTGALTSACAIGALVCLIASPNSLLYASFYFCIGRLYSNSLLATLNARKNIRGQVDDEHLMVSIPASALSSGTPTGTHNRSKNIARSQRISIHVATAKEYLADDGDHKMNDDSGDSSTGGDPYSESDPSKSKSVDDLPLATVL